MILDKVIKSNAIGINNHIVIKTRNFVTESRKIKRDRFYCLDYYYNNHVMLMLLKCTITYKH